MFFTTRYQLGTLIPIIRSHTGADPLGYAICSPNCRAGGFASQDHVHQEDQIQGCLNSTPRLLEFKFKAAWIQGCMDSNPWCLNNLQCVTIHAHSVLSVVDLSSLLAWCRNNHNSRYMLSPEVLDWPFIIASQHLHSHYWMAPETCQRSRVYMQIQILGILPSIHVTFSFSHW